MTQHILGYIKQQHLCNKTRFLKKKKPWLAESATQANGKTRLWQCDAPRHNMPHIEQEVEDRLVPPDPPSPLEQGAEIAAPHRNVCNECNVGRVQERKVTAYP